jgi:hypothetical protein
MSKLNVIILAFIGVFLFAGQTFAFQTSSIEKTDITESTFYRGTFNNLVLDFSITPAAADTLTAVSLINSGTATPDFQIDRLTLWADAGAVGFQGLGIDRKLGDFFYLGSNFNWFLSGLDEKVIGESRFFVTAELYGQLSKSATIQMQIPQLQDNNSNNLFDLGDLGLFLKSGDNGPSNTNVINGIQYISTLIVDSWGPVARITNITDGQVIDNNTYQIKGVIRDQGFNGIKDLILEIDGQQNSISDYDANTYLWQFNWNNIVGGNHTIKVISHDQGGNAGEVQTLSVTLSTVVVPPVVPPVTPPTTGKSYTFGDLIKASGATVYYFGQDGKRYVFPTLATYKTWYPDFLTVKTTTDLDLGTVLIGGNVTYRPGVKLVKITTDPKVYAVGANGTLRWITTEAVAIALYGANWGSLVEDVPDPFFINYTVGAAITNVADYSPAAVTGAATSINVDKGL